MYKPHLAGHGHEVPHGLWIYPTYSFSCGAPIFLSAAKVATPYTTTLTFECEKPYVPNAALLNFEAFAKMQNQVGVMCTNQAGYTSIRILDLMKTSGKRFVQTLVVPNSKKAQSKGQLILICTSAGIDGVYPAPTHNPISLEKFNERVYRGSRRVKAYIEKNYQFYEKHPARFHAISTLSVFSYAGARGAIPGCMFDVFHLPKSREEYYLNALRIAIQRMKPFDKVDDIYVASFMESAPKDDKVVATMSMLCIFVNWCEYLTDETDNNTEEYAYSPSKVEPMESFDKVRQRNAADCEDFVGEVMTQSCEIKYNLDSFKSAPMLTCRAILNEFIIVSVLCGVSDASISFSSSSSSSSSEQSLKGHECGMAIPKYIFFKAISRGPLGEKHPLLSLYSEEERQLGKDLSICVLEGTGNLHPCAKTQSQVNACILDLLLDELPESITDHMKKEYFFDPKGTESFYKVILAVLTPEFFLEKGYRGFEFLVVTTAKDGSGDTTRGVPFVEILEIDKFTENSFVEAPRIPLKTFHAASNVDYDNFPPIVINPPPLVPFSPPDLPSCASLPDIDDVVKFQISFEKATPEFIETIRTKVASLNLKMIHVPERVKFDVETDELVGGYSFFVFR
jgi:hypothetical protein